jgi:hypothetical protein
MPRPWDRRYCEELVRLVLIAGRLRGLKGKQGPAGKESHAFRDAAIAKSSRITECLLEIDLWRKQVGLHTPALTKDREDEMLRTGIVPTTLLLGHHVSTLRARQLYFGKLYFVTRHEVTRLEEECAYIPLEVENLVWWLNDKLDRIECALVVEDVSVGTLPDAWEHLDASLHDLLRVYSAPPAGNAGELAASEGVAGEDAKFTSHGRQFELLQKQSLLRKLLAEVRGFNSKLPLEDHLPVRETEPQQGDAAVQAQQDQASTSHGADGDSDEGRVEDEAFGSVAVSESESSYDDEVGSH